MGKGSHDMSVCFSQTLGSVEDPIDGLHEVKNKDFRKQNVPQGEQLPYSSTPADIEARRPENNAEKL